MPIKTLTVTLLAALALIVAPGSPLGPGLRAETAKAGDLTLYAQLKSATDPVRFTEVARFIDDAPVYMGDDLSFLPIFSISDLIKSVRDIYKKDNYDINIYNLDTVKSHPIQSPYIGLVSDKDQQGFVVITPGGEDEAIRDNVPEFSFTCTIEYSDLFGSLCYDTVIKLDGKKISPSDAVKNNPAIRDAIKNSTRSPWNEAG